MLICKYIARLVTDRQLERGVQYFGPDADGLEKHAIAWLESHGRAGDAFQLIELKEEVIKNIAYKAPKSPAVIKQDNRDNHLNQLALAAKKVVHPSMLVDKTSKVDCVACNERRLHTTEEWHAFHPLLCGSDFSAEHGSPRPKQVTDFDPKAAKAQKSIP